jgi:hypothetical protein
MPRVLNEMPDLLDLHKSFSYSGTVRLPIKYRKEIRDAIP